MSSAAGFVGIPSKAQIPGLCASCHSSVDLMRPYNIPTDQFDQYWQSQHGEALVKGDQNVATCFDCHGGHKVLNVQDPGATVYPTNEPAMCAGCHADGTRMGSYNIPTNQFNLYQTSVHGVAVLKNQDLRAPTCSTCHGIHGATPPGLAQVATVCGQCHSQTQEYYQQGAHKVGLSGQAGPGCVTCHGQHDVAAPTLDLYLGVQDRHCGMCHAPGTATAAKVDSIYQALKGAGDAYVQAQQAIAVASAKHLIVTQQDETFQQANTPLIEAAALQHTVNVTDIQAKAKESADLSQQAQAAAQTAVKEVGTRYVGMYISVVVLLLIVVCLALIKRELDRDLQARRARRGDRSS
jgi:predicted CXXCH cytochrome family protein